MNLRDIAQCLHLPCPQDAPISNITLDSRKVIPGSLFVALEGSQTDGHQFAQDAEKRGAAAVLCAHVIENVHIPQLIVNSPAEALGRIATEHRKQFSLPIIALTGSNGKTTVKEMIYACLPKPSIATQGNLNNHLGVPLSLLRLAPEHRYAVFELGANHPGEIAYTADLVNPDVALINNIAPAHVGEFGSIEAIARSKGEIYAALPPHGTAVINADDHYAHFWDPILKGRNVFRFSRHATADLFATNIRIDEKGCAEFVLNLPNLNVSLKLHVAGEHQISNALAAASCCYAAGIDITHILHGLSHFRGVPGRQTFLEGYQGATVIDDTYNANLRSVLAAIDVLAQCRGKRILILGDMGELGEHTQAHHETVGKVAKEKQIDELLTYGRHSQFATHCFGEPAIHFYEQNELIAFLKPKLEKQMTILVKGSRLAAMEKIVAALVPPT